MRTRTRCAAGHSARGQRTLGVGGGGDRRGCLREHDEERVTLRAAFRRAVPAECLAKDGVVALEDLGEDGRAEVLDEPGRALHVREQEGHRPGREHPLGHPPRSIRPGADRSEGVGYHPAGEPPPARRPRRRGVPRRRARPRRGRGPRRPSCRRGRRGLRHEQLDALPGRLRDPPRGHGCPGHARHRRLVGAGQPPSTSPSRIRRSGASWCWVPAGSNGRRGTSGWRW